MREKKIGCVLLAIAAPFLYMTIQLLAAQGIIVAAAVYFSMQSGAADLSEAAERLIHFVENHGMSLTITSQLIGLAVFGFWYYRAVVRKIGRTVIRSVLHPQNTLGLALLAFGTYLGTFLYLIFLGLIFPDRMAVYNSYMTNAGVAELSLISTVVTVIMAPLVEELIFRGVSYHYLQNTGVRFWLANIVQAALFALIHMQLIQGSYAFVLGLICGCLMRRFKTLLAPIIFHCLFNFSGTYLAVGLEQFEVTPGLMLLVILGMSALLAAGMKLMD